MVFNLGVMAGALLFGFLSDKFGRKRTFIAALVSQALIGCGTAAAPNFYVFTALRFVVGALEQVPDRSSRCYLNPHPPGGGKQGGGAMRRDKRVSACLSVCLSVH